jgi:hypothetical protein
MKWFWRVSISEKQISENLQISIFCIQYVLPMNID